MEEGGLGIRKLKDLMLALRMKMAWRIKATNSLWSRFMNSKYGPMGSSRLAIKGPSNWKRIQAAGLKLKDNLAWSVGKVDLSFWFD